MRLDSRLRWNDYRKFRPQIGKPLIAECKNVILGEFIRVVFYRLVDAFALNPVEFCDIAIQQHTLPPDLDDQLCQVFDFNDIAHLFLINPPCTILPITCRTHSFSSIPPPRSDSELGLSGAS